MSRDFPDRISRFFGWIAIGFIAASSVVQAQTVAYYRFENGANQANVGGVTDSGPNHLNGTSVGVTPLKYSSTVVGVFGITNLLSLDARGDYNFARVPDNALFHVQGDLTVETFVRLNSPYATNGDGGTEWIINKRDTLAGGSYLSAWGLYYIPSTGRFGTEIGCYGTGDSGVYLNSTIANIHDTNWHHLAEVLKRKGQGTNDTLTLYIDGVQQGQAAGVFGDLRYNSDDLLIGAANFSTSDGTDYYRRNFDGYIDEVRITASALSPSQFLQQGFPVTGSVMLDGVADVSAVKVPIARLAFTIRPRNGAAPFTQSAMLIPVAGSPALGRYTLPAILPGSYDILIKGSKQLQVLEDHVSVNEATTIADVPTLAGGDADGSNIVNFDDFLVLLNAFGAVYDPMNTGNGYDTTADFNYDGVVNFDDFLILLNNFGVSGDV